MFLTTTEFKETLERKLNNAEREVLILSAFLKEGALEWIITNTKASKISVVTRWLPQDLKSSSSDLSCYEVCRNHGIRFGIVNRLHGKVYCVDGHVLVGSANATASGLALTDGHNDEFGFCFEAGVADHNKLKSYLNSVTWVDDRLFSILTKELSKITSSSSSYPTSWSEEIKSQLKPSGKEIWVHELPLLSPEQLKAHYVTNDSGFRHDIELLGLHINKFTMEEAISGFAKSRAYSWCHDVIRECQSISFGEMTAKLHNSVLDDPIPYRRQIKDLTSVLFSWAECYPSVFAITRPNYRQVIKLV